MLKKQTPLISSVMSACLTLSFALPVRASGSSEELRATLAATQQLRMSKAEEIDNKFAKLNKLNTVIKAAKDMDVIPGSYQGYALLLAVTGLGTALRIGTTPFVSSTTIEHYHDRGVALAARIAEYSAGDKKLIHQYLVEATTNLSTKELAFVLQGATSRGILTMDELVSIKGVSDSRMNRAIALLKLRESRVRFAVAVASALLGVGSLAYFLDNSSSAKYVSPEAKTSIDQLKSLMEQGKQREAQDLVNEQVADAALIASQVILMQEELRALNQEVEVLRAH